MWGKSMVVVGLAIIAPCICGDTWGANFEIDALPAAAFDPVTFAPIPLTLDSSGNLVGNRSMMVQVDIDVFSSGYNAAHDERGFGAMTFSLDLFGSFSNTTRPGWMANNPLVEHFRDWVICSPRWDDNLDAGKQGDLKYILLSNPVISNPNPLDPRPSLTTGAPVKVGSVFVDWDGVGSGGMTNFSGPSGIRPKQRREVANVPAGRVHDDRRHVSHAGLATTSSSADCSSAAGCVASARFDSASRFCAAGFDSGGFAADRIVPRGTAHNLAGRPCAGRAATRPNAIDCHSDDQHGAIDGRSAKQRQFAAVAISRHHGVAAGLGANQLRSNFLSLRKSMPPRRCSLATGSCSWLN